jgi:hypothetical protein
MPKLVHPNPAEVAADLRSFAIMMGPCNAMQARVIEAADLLDPVPCKHGCIDHSTVPGRCEDCGAVVEFIS